MSIVTELNEIQMVWRLSYDIFVRSIEPNFLLPGLISKLVINFEEKDIIESFPTRKERAEKFIDIMKRKDKDSLSILITLLRNRNENAIANCLNDNFKKSMELNSTFPQPSDLVIDREYSKLDLEESLLNRLADNLMKNEVLKLTQNCGEILTQVRIEEIEANHSKDLYRIKLEFLYAWYRCQRKKYNLFEFLTLIQKNLSSEFTKFKEVIDKLVKI